MKNVTTLIVHLLSVSFVLLPHSLRAADFPCASGDTACLVAAIDDANTNGEENTILLAAGRYELFSVRRLLTVSTPFSLTIRGQAAESTFIVGHPLFESPAIFVETKGNLTLDALTVTGSVGGLNSAGGIFNRGTLNVINSKIDSNRAIEGAGGGIYNEGTAQIANSSITNNTAVDLAVPTLGGGIWNAGTAELVNSTVSNNTVVNGSGAGIANTGVMTIISSSITGNEASGGRTSSGGGISNFGTLRIASATIARNVAIPGSFSGTPVSGAGIFNTGTAELQNTILGLNTLGESVDASGPDCDGPLTSLGNNFIGDLSGCGVTLQTSDLSGDPGLGEFSDTGFPGGGHIPLLLGSPLINAGDGTACAATDQLGNPRVGVCDIGAIEFTGETAGKLLVNIDVRPKSDANRINPNSTKDFNVAVFSSSGFDSRIIDPDTIRLGVIGDEAAPVHVRWRDVDGDGNHDLVARFKIPDLGIRCGDTSVTLTGRVSDGQSFSGSTSVTTTCKTQQQTKPFRSS